MRMSTLPSPSPAVYPNAFAGKLRSVSMRAREAGGNGTEESEWMPLCRGCGPQGEGPEGREQWDIRDSEEVWDL